MILTEKQTIALDILEDNENNELLFGGAAGGGKSALGCYWITKRRFKYPGTRGLIGRSELKVLKATTLKTLFEVFAMQGIKAHMYSHNRQDCEIKFYNGSEIVYRDLFEYPSDPNFDDLGSLEITDVFIDEAVQVTDKAKDIVNSRIRYKLDEFGLIPKTLYTSNPGRGWLYDAFYIPYKEKRLPDYQKFIQSLLPDNPYISKHYKTQLEKLTEEDKQRLLFGNWDYEAKGMVFPYFKLKRFDLSELSQDNRTILGWCDVADQGTDYLCLPFGQIVNGNVYIVDVVFTPKDDETSIPLIIDKLEFWNPNLVYFESNGPGLAFLKLIKKTMELMDSKNGTELYKKWLGKLKAIPNSQAKHSRICMQAETSILSNFYFLKTQNEMYSQYFKNMTEYKYDKSVKHDDAPDATAGLSLLVQKYI